MANSETYRFTGYEKFVVGLLAFLQFCVVVDFMILSPLGAFLLRDLHIATSQFGLVVSAYAFSAGLSGFLTAGFADRFDRKKLLLFFYSGFVLGTVLCALAPDYHALLGARIVTGLFGGVISSISFAIVGDLFPMQVRGRVMGTVQAAFAASQVLGIPLGLYFANHWGWHSPFFLIAGLSTVVGIVAFVRLGPIDAHLKVPHSGNALAHLWKTASKPRHLMGYSATVLLATGGFMLMPFSSAFSVHNLGVSLEKLPFVYVVTGIVSMMAGPLLGRWSDSIGKFRLFAMGTVGTIVLCLYYTNMGLSPLWLVILVNVILFVFINARMVAASALNSGVPLMQDRGAYMSVNASIQQISGGVASWVAGLIVVQSPDGSLLHYPILGIAVTLAATITLPLMWKVNQMVLTQPR